MMPLSHGLYQYTPLPDKQNSFRYLELLPGEKSDPVSYRLELGDLRKPPQYEALSYAWGNPNVKVASKCDGQLVEITPSFYEALRHLRRKAEIRRL